MSEKTIPQELVKEFVIAAHGDLDKVKAMHAQEPDLIDIPNAETGETPLAAAAHMGNRPIAEYILAQGVPTNICTAAMLGQAETVRQFLEADSTQATAVGAHGIPIMFHVALSGHTEIADMILEHGGGEGLDHALHGAIARRHVDMVRWLLEHGADTDTKDFRGKRPLEVAQEMDAAEIVAALKAHGAE